MSRRKSSRASSVNASSNPAFFAGDDGADDTTAPQAATLAEANDVLNPATLEALTQVLQKREETMSEAQLALVLAAFNVGRCRTPKFSHAGVAKRIRIALRDEAVKCGSWGKAAVAFATGQSNMSAVLQLGSPAKVLVFSWNVGNKMPDEAELAHWCPEGGSDFDLVVVGTQENKYKKKNVDSPVSAVSDDDVDDDEEDYAPTEEEIAEQEAQEQYERAVTQKERNHWDMIVAKRLGMDWGVVKSGVLWQMRLTVYAPLRHIAGDMARISDVDMRKSRTGIGGVVANKGGLVCKLNFAGTTLCFVSSHLAAHSHKLKQRNDNCQEILRETGRLAANHLDAASQFDHVFWLGDLNYRIDLNSKAKEEGRPEKSHDAHMAEVQGLVAKGNYEELVKWDQLKIAQNDGEAFVNFIEGPLNFKPTFKVLRHEGTEYKHNRIPSFCDRVLWKSMPQRLGAVRQTLFTGLEVISTSDHKPVVAHFEIDGSREVKTIPLKQLARAPLLQFTALKAESVRAADMNGKSDPYVVFYSNPPGLFGSRPPLSKIKKETRNPEWATAEVPVLRPLVESVNDLKECALILVLYDSDLVGSNDPLGRAIVKLGPEDDSVDLLKVTSYEVEFNKAIIHGNKSAGMGTIQGKFTVSFGETLGAAVQEVKRNKVGSKAKRKQKAPSACVIA
eukprot:m.43685 g.43685  ORF g.43685 m.43685 type:complete len:674 (+) comp8459_c0_seq2:216-2237(+)